ncbi:MAG: histidine kinase [Prevotella sp.]|nr:histidine kinase [Prevotella sp.]
MRHLTKLTLILMALASVLASCHNGTTWGDERSPEEMERLSAVGDSVDAQSPHARAMIDSALVASKDSLTYYDYYVELVRLYLMEQPDSALPLCNHLLYYAKRQPSTPRTNGLLAEAYHLRANYFILYRTHQEEVLNDNLIAYRLFMASDKPDNVPSICANIGDVYIQQSLLPDAAAWYRRALVVSDSLHLPHDNEYTLYMGLGHIYCLLKDYTLSEEYYAKAREGYDAMQASMKMAYLNNYGNLQYYKGDYKKALSVFQSLDSLIQQLGLQGGPEDNLCHLNMADVYLNLGKTKESMECLERADSFFRAYGVGDCIYYGNTIRIGNILKTGNVSQISSILAHEPTGLTQDENMIDIRNSYLHDYYVSVGNRQRADYYEQINLARKDSIDKSRAYMRSSDIMSRLEMDTLMLHNQLRMEAKNAEMEHNRFLFILIAGGILLVALVLLALYLYQNKKRKESEIEIANLKIDNTRNIISPHFTFNVLQHALSGIPQDSQRTINSVIKLMHDGINASKQKYTTLQEELEFTKQYIEVATATMGDSFTYHIHIPEGELQESRRIPSTFIQILAENAIKHGLRGLDRPKELTIEVAFTDDATTIHVIDNGKGFDIRNRSKDNSTGTGLRVIRNTMALHNKVHHEKINYDIENIEDGKGNIIGCKSTLVIPASFGK